MKTHLRWFQQPGFFRFITLRIRFNTMLRYTDIFRRFFPISSVRGTFESFDIIYSGEHLQKYQKQRYNSSNNNNNNSNNNYNNSNQIQEFEIKNTQESVLRII